MVSKLKGIRKPTHATQELSTPFSPESMFSSFNDGLVFSYDMGQSRDYQEMLDTDGKAAGIEKLLTFPILSASWDLEKPENDKGQTDLVRRALSESYHEGANKTPINKVIAQLTSAITFRRAYFEKVFKVNDKNELIYDKIGFRPAETCEMGLDEKTAEYAGFRQMPVILGRQSYQNLNKEGWIYIPPEKAFVYVHGSWRDPIEGISSMQIPYWCWQTKRKIRYLWYQYIETTSLPRTIVQNADPDRAMDHARKVATLKSRGVLGLTNDTDIDTLESSGKGADQFVQAMKWLDSEMSQSILGGFMDLSSQAAEGKGSYALSQDQSKLYLRSRKVVAQDMAMQITRQVVAPLVWYNFGRKAEVPKFQFGPMSENNEDQIVDMFSKFVTSRVQPPREFVRQLTQRTASILELDPVTIGNRLDTAAGGDQSELDQMMSSVDAATQMVKQKAEGMDPLVDEGQSGGEQDADPQQQNTS